MKLTKREWIAGAATFTVVVVVLVVLLVCGLTARTPLSEEGLSVSFGDVALSSGTSEALPEAQQTHAPTPSLSPDEPLLTDNDESVFLDAEKKKKEEEEARRRQEEERRRREQEAQAAQIKNQVANAFQSSRNDTDAQRGDGDRPAGTQGSAQGSAQTANLAGAGEGYASWSLDGRSLAGGLPRPSYTIEEEGVVAVRIVVNSEGAVVSADIEINGTTTSDTRLRSAALQAARQTRFNPIAGHRNQSGTITYRFRLK